METDAVLRDPGETGRLRAAADAAAARTAFGPLRRERGRAFEAFARSGFPTTADEDWRYTDIRDAAAQIAARTGLGMPAPSVVDRIAPDALVPVPAAATLIFSRGRFRADLSRPGAETGLRLSTFADATPADLEAITSRLRSPSDDKALVSLNTALSADGLWIAIAPGVSIDEPIYVVFASDESTVSHPRLMVDLGAGSKATIIEHHLSAGPAISNSVTDVRCQHGSALGYVKLQAESNDATHLATQYFDIGSAAHLELLHLDLGGRLSRNELAIRLSGRDATSSAHGLFFADGSRHLDNHTRIDHVSPHTTSREVYRGIADGSGRGVFNGKIVVHEGAAKADARLTSQNLLLSAGAEIDTKPELEIYTDDVKCSHGATTGQLDSNAIFYLRSRGIPANQARRMLISSFVREIIRHTPVAALEAPIVLMLRERLPELAEQP